MTTTNRDGPGFYQGKQQGLKSGRVSPREAIRAPRRNTVNAAHGIISSGAADVNQGQFFNINSIASVPEADIVRRAGGAPRDPLASHKGFMPGITAKQKVLGIKRLGDHRDAAGTTRSYDIKTRKAYSPVKEAMEDSAAVLGRSRDRDWYAGRVTERQSTDFGIEGRTPQAGAAPLQGPPGMSGGMRPHGEVGGVSRQFDFNEPQVGHIKAGMAGDLIADVAQRQGVSHASATRATAITSPQTAWDIEHAGPKGRSGGMHRPNLESAENVIHDVQALGPDPLHERIVAAGREAHGEALNSMKAKAAVELAKGHPSQPIPVWAASAAKVPNFEQGLHLDNPSKTVQAQAAESSTVDAWEARTMGMDAESMSTAGDYGTAAMVGSRASIKAGQVAPRGQSARWETIRRENEPTSMGHSGLWATNRKGVIHPNPLALPGASVIRKQLHEGGTHDDRSEFAKKMGTDF